MKKILLTTLFILLTSIYCFGQKEANWWYFGYNAGLNFTQLQTVVDSKGTPTDNMLIPISGTISTNEGCFTLSDMDGNLMMSSDGVKVYNKNNAQMPLG